MSSFRAYDLSKPLYLIGDVHGCFDTLIKLIATLPQRGDSQLVFVGDLIDRGPRSAEVVGFVRENGFACVLGNHEDLMLEYHFPHRNMSYSSAWLQNGGIACMRSYYKLSTERMYADLEWLDTLPYFLEFDVCDDKGQKLYVTHGFGLPYYPERAHAKEEIIWSRLRSFDLSEVSKATYGVYNVFGHDVQKEVLVESNFACIDTGCVYAPRNSSKAGGALSAMEWPSKLVFSQPFCDKVAYE